MNIKIENLSKSYTKGKLVLQPLDLEIADGELFFLLGGYLAELCHKAVDDSFFAEVFETQGF